MNRISILFLFLVFSIIGCTKSSYRNSNPIDNSLVARWTYVEYYFSIGGPGEWHPVQPANQEIEFKSDGSFVSTESFLKGVTRYEIIDSVTIKVKPVSRPSGYMLMGYKINTIDRELYLYPVDPYCIEGCGNKFKR
jgi:hypothetical protein